MEPGKRGDVGRCIVADVDPDSPNMEYWSSMNSGMYNCGGPTDAPVSSDMPTGIGGGTLYNAAIWWEWRATRELFDRALIVSYKANPRTNKNRLVNFAGGYGSNQGNHSTKNIILVIMVISWVTGVRKLSWVLQISQRFIFSLRIIRQSIVSRIL